MVLFGAYHTAERFVDEGKAWAGFPGPGTYAPKSSVEDVPVPRYADEIVLDGCIRPDGSKLLFRQRDSWVRGAEGPQVPAAFLNIREARYLSPHKRCLTAAHEREAKGSDSPGPGGYYAMYSASDFPTPENWDHVDKTWRVRKRGFNTKSAWGDAESPRPPVPARAEDVPGRAERAWLKRQRRLIRPSTAPRCMWVAGVITRGGLQAWGDAATPVGPRNCNPPTEPAPRSGRKAQRRGPIHSGETRSTAPEFREVRYLDRELMKRSAGVGRQSSENLGPGSYDVRPAMSRGTCFAPPASRKKTAVKRQQPGLVKPCPYTTTTAGRISDCLIHKLAGGGPDYGAWADTCSYPSPRLIRENTERLSTPERGRDSPGPSYALPSFFHVNRTNKQNFGPPAVYKPPLKMSKRQAPQANGSGGATPADRDAATARRGEDLGGHGLGLVKELSRVCQAMVNSAAPTEALLATNRKLQDPSIGVLVLTSLGKGLLLAVREDGMRFVKLPWGVLYTMEHLRWVDGEGNRT